MSGKKYVDIVMADKAFLWKQRLLQEDDLEAYLEACHCPRGKAREGIATERSQNKVRRNLLSEFEMNSVATAENAIHMYF